MGGPPACGVAVAALPARMCCGGWARRSVLLDAGQAGPLFVPPDFPRAVPRVLEALPRVGRAPPPGWGPARPPRPPPPPPPPPPPTPTPAHQHPPSTHPST